ncbi:MAG: diadenosine tetraphosphate (Ap4A) HIT family hydrolase [Planctomycetota bacterium]|jgi:diadenosine tetraphosphate (Ap4A) HIT family hydrolase
MGLLARKVGQFPKGIERQRTDMFQIHERLLADTFDLGKFDLSFVRLHRSSDVPWFILIPEVNVTEIFELDEGARSQLTAEVDLLSRFVSAETGVEKVNVAAIGNLVPQMHIHVIGRNPSDPFWPGVVWGEEMSGKSYDEGQVTDYRRRLET